MFDKATRLKLRFDSPKGALSVEDLWDLPLTSATGKPNLNDIAIGLHHELRENQTISFVTPAAPKSEELQLKFDVVKHVIDVRVTERDKAAEAAKRAETKQKILATLEAKEDEALKSKSPEELRQLLATL